MASHKVGGEVDAFCTRCKMTLAHIILAMVGTKIARVRCNTCGGDHAFRSAPGTTTRTPSAARSSKADKAEKVVISFQEQLATRDLASAPMYSPRDSYILDQVINHPTFGYGIVTAVRHDKVDVSFKGQQKTLVHQRGEVQSAKPAYNPPRSQARAPADKPVAEGAETAPQAPEPAGEADGASPDE